jgi:PKD domain
MSSRIFMRRAGFVPGAALALIAAMSVTSWVPAARAGTPLLSGASTNAAADPSTCSTTNGSPSISIEPASVSGLSASINGVVIAADGTQLTGIDWNWGDGTTLSGCSYFPESHTYSSAGTYTVVVTATESNGGQLQTSESVTVGSSSSTCSTTNGAPSVSLEPASVSGLSASINGLAIAADGTQLTGIDWNWGDGTTESGCQYFPQFHTYAESGEYAVTVIANESTGSTLSATEYVTVSGTQGPPSVVLAASQVTPTSGTSENLTATVTSNTDTPLPNIPVSFSVVSGPDDGTAGSIATNAQGIASFSYVGSSTGTDEIQASVSTSSGNSTSNEVAVTWGPAPITSTFAGLTLTATLQPAQSCISAQANAGTCYDLSIGLSPGSQEEISMTAAEAETIFNYLQAQLLQQGVQLGSSPSTLDNISTVDSGYVNTAAVDDLDVLLGAPGDLAGLVQNWNDFGTVVGSGLSTLLWYQANCDYEGSSDSCYQGDPPTIVANMANQIVLLDDQAAEWTETSLYQDVNVFDAQSSSGQTYPQFTPTYMAEPGESIAFSWGQVVLPSNSTTLNFNLPPGIAQYELYPGGVDAFGFPQECTDSATCYQWDLMALNTTVSVSPPWGCGIVCVCHFGACLGGTTSQPVPALYSGATSAPDTPASFTPNIEAVSDDVNVVASGIASSGGSGSGNAMHDEARSASATATAGTVSVTSVGAGTTSVVQYGGDPAGFTSFQATGAFFGIAVASGSDLSKSTVSVCNPNSGNRLYWLDGTNWQPTTPAARSSAGCLLFSAKQNGTSPTTTGLGNAEFAVGGPAYLYANPSSGPPASTMNVNGGGFTTGSVATVSYSTGLSGRKGRVSICSATVETGGTFSCTGSVPQGVAAGSMGAHLMTAKDSKVKASMTFTLT